MGGKELKFAWDVYRGCRISALALYDNYNREWVPKAHLFWKKPNQEHLATVSSDERFANHRDAEKHALKLAHDWVDQHLPF